MKTKSNLSWATSPCYGEKLQAIWRLIPNECEHWPLRLWISNENLVFLTVGFRVNIPSLTCAWHALQTQEGTSLRAAWCSTVDAGHLAAHWLRARSTHLGALSITFFIKALIKKGSIKAVGSIGLHFPESLKPKLTVTLTHTVSAGSSNSILTSVTLGNSREAQCAVSKPPWAALGKKQASEVQTD